MNPCSGCHAGCCRAFAVPVGPADILRICREYRLAFLDVVTRWPDPLGHIARGQAPQFFFDDDPDMPYVIGLRHEASDLFPGTTHCRFLRELPEFAGQPHGASECSIYRHRPEACRIFPVTGPDLVQLQVLDLPEYGRPGSEPAYRLCPRPLTIDELDAAGAWQAMRRAADDLHFFGLMASLWNRVPRPWELFPEFVMLAQAERDSTPVRRAA